MKQEPESSGDLSPKEESGGSATVKSESDSNSENNAESEEGGLGDSKEGLVKKEGVKLEDGLDPTGACLKTEPKDAARSKESELVRDLRAQLK